MKFKELILHPISRKSLENYLQDPTHALLLTGENGVGLGTIAQSLAARIAGAQQIKIRPRLQGAQKNPNINIDDIRELYQIARNTRRKNLVIIIDEAEKMTREAPQALLKLLEEPVANFFYILTSHAPERLPATIRSRSQAIEILRDLNADDLIFSNFTKLTREKYAQIKFLAGGRPAEISRLLADEQYFRDAAAKIESAKIFIQGDVAARLKIVANTGDRAQAIDLLKNISRIITMTVHRVKTDNLTKMTQNLQILSDASDNLLANGNVRAQLISVAVSFN